MKKVCILILSLILMVGTGFSQTFDPGYTKKFGYGVVIASCGGFPDFTKYDESQFKVKNNNFMFQPGEESTINMRVILPQGTTIGSLLNKLKKEKPQNIKNKTNEYNVWSVWSSHSDGKSQVTAERPWPKKKTDIPLWSSPCVEIFRGQDESWTTTAVKWDQDGGNLKFEMGSKLHSALPGEKFYITWRVAYEYSVPGGQAEQKWNSVLSRFETVISTGGIGYVFSDPIAVGVVEIDANDDPTGRFVDNGNGTVTDKKTNLMWEKSPQSKILFWNEAKAYTDNLKLAGFSDWRLPTLAEFSELIKVSKIKDKPNECNWLNENGFSNIQASTYWCGDANMQDGTESGKYNVDFLYKNNGSNDVNYQYCSWAVRTIK